MCIEKIFNGALYILSLWTSTWTPKWNFMTNGAFTWNFTQNGFWTLQTMANKYGMQYFLLMMLVENIDIKFIHKFNLLSKICTKMIFPCHRIYPSFGDWTVVRSTSLQEYPLKIIWESSTMCIEKIFNKVLYMVSLGTSKWTPKWNFMPNGLISWFFTKMCFWTNYIIEKASDIRYFYSTMLVESIDIKFIHKFKMVNQNCKKMKYQSHRLCSVFVTEMF